MILGTGTRRKSLKLCAYFTSSFVEQMKVFPNRSSNLHSSNRLEAHSNVKYSYVMWAVRTLARKLIVMKE